MAQSFSAPLLSAPEMSESVYSYAAKIVWHSTVWTSFMPPPTHIRILEKSAMEPWYGTDESRQKVRGKEDADICIRYFEHDYDPC